MKTWIELMDTKIPKTLEERCIIQLICALSTQGRYQHMTPDDIYAEFSKRAREIFAGDPRLEEMEKMGL